MIYTPAVGRQTKFYGSAIDAKTDRLGSRRTRSRLILVRPQQRRAETTADLEHPAAPGQHPRLVLYSDQSAADSQPKRPFFNARLKCEDFTCNYKVSKRIYVHLNRYRMNDGYENVNLGSASSA